MFIILNNSRNNIYIWGRKHISLIRRGFEYLSYKYTILICCRGRKLKYTILICCRGRKLKYTIFICCRGRKLKYTIFICCRGRKLKYTILICCRVGNSNTLSSSVVGQETQIHYLHLLSGKETQIHYLHLLSGKETHQNFRPALITDFLFLYKILQYSTKCSQPCQKVTSHRQEGQL